MGRGLIDAALLFLLPFAGYALFLAVQRRFPNRLEHWARGPVAILTVSGLALAVAGILLAGVFADRHRGGYVPAHIENGRLVPGRME